MNEVILVGRLGHDPETRYTKTGKAVCNLSIGVNEKIKRGNGYELVTTWHRIVLWQGLAEDAQSLRKGQPVRVTGFQKSRTWTGRDGGTRTTVEIIAEQFTVLDSLPQPATSAPAKPKSNGGVPRAQIPDDEIPY